MVSLRTDRDPRESAFDDIFKDVDRNAIRLVQECHGSEQDDANYVFLIWLFASSDEASIGKQLEVNAGDIATVVAAAAYLYIWTEDAC